MAQLSIKIRAFKSIITCDLAEFNLTTFTQKLSNLSEYDDIARNTFIGVSSYEALFAPATDVIQSVGLIEDNYQASIDYFIDRPSRTQYNTVNGFLVTSHTLSERLKYCSIIPLIFERLERQTNIGWVCDATRKETASF